MTDPKEERTKEQREDDYLDFKELVDLLKNYFGVSEDIVVKFILNWINTLNRSSIIQKKTGLMASHFDNMLVSKDRQEIIRWCCYRYNTLKRKAIQDEQKSS